MKHKMVDAVCSCLCVCRKLFEPDVSFCVHCKPDHETVLCFDSDHSLWNWFGNNTLRAERSGNDFLILKKWPEGFEIEHRWIDSSMKILGQSFSGCFSERPSDDSLFDQFSVWY